MSRRGLGFAFSMLAALALAAPFAASANSGKDTKAVSAQMDIVNDSTIAGKQLKAGTYDVKATDTKVTLSRNGKVVAEAPVEWKDGDSKQKFSSIVTDGGAVKEIHFNGKSRYAQIATGEATASGQQ